MQRAAAPAWGDTDPETPLSHEEVDEIYYHLASYAGDSIEKYRDLSEVLSLS